ncbi:glutamine--fructose-6-phosphate transaminase (isomerizing) [Kiloniella sp. b19]|uniref:glutamine--fructose-6-phosphate transaminase (isomerizing) n=1 Tax=Kiloniella sp. GXU_MW_B19 TaxID=3141326 RepID=UPI0031DBA9AB
MCGIIGIVGNEAVAPLLLDGLKRLEYRGYDSAGIATVFDGQLERRRAEGKLRNLEAVVADQPLSGTIGIGHTRWATHGRPTVNNAHPHATAKVSLVHNGIVENYKELKAELAGKGVVFETETDTEVVVQMISAYLDEGLAPKEAAFETLQRLEGAFALAIVFAGHGNLMIGARKGSPLAVGYGEEGMYLGSDALALAPLTNRLSYLEEGDWVVLSRDSVEIYEENGEAVERAVVQSAVSGAMIGKGQYRHFMQKEIFEQPAVIGDTLHTFYNPETGRITLPEFPFDLTSIPRITVIGCGSASLAGWTAKYWLEQEAAQLVEIDIASEFRYREAPMPEGGVSLFISQSGETSDTLAALHYAKSRGQKIVSVVNVPESAIARESDMVLPTLAGPEIGVASTKAFITQLTVLACLSLAIGRAKGVLTEEREAELSRALSEVPARVSEILNHDQAIRSIAVDVAEARDVLYLARGNMYPIALEGALKLKEISYIHAEGYAAGEMKHGPIALIDENVPIIACAPSGPLLEKTISNLQEAHARGGQVILISDAEGLAKAGDIARHAIEIPAIDPFVAPILYTIPIQLLAYHTAVLKGTDVDQPRNLAKSVTVE